MDALEKEVLGGPEHRLDGGYPDGLSPAQQNDVAGEPDDVPPGDGSKDPTSQVEPAFAIDVDPEDQGSSDVAPRNPD